MSLSRDRDHEKVVLGPSLEPRTNLEHYDTTGANIRNLSRIFAGCLIRTRIYARRHFNVDDLLQLCKVGHQGREGGEGGGRRAWGRAVTLCVHVCARFAS